MEIHYNTRTRFQSQFLKIHYELLEKKYFSDAVDNLHAAYPRITADCYNRALNSLLFHFCIALGSSGRPMSSKTYEKLMRLPMYQNLSDGTRFMAKTRETLKEMECKRRIRKQLEQQLNLNYDEN